MFSTNPRLLEPWLDGHQPGLQETAPPSAAKDSHTIGDRYSRMVLDGHEVGVTECFLRVCSACLASGIIGVSGMTDVLVRLSSPGSGSQLDTRLNWVIGLPIAGFALLWQIIRLALLAWHDQSSSHGVLLAASIVMEALLGIGSAVCATLAGFQAARHRAYNHSDNRSETPDSLSYHDIGAAISQTVLLGLLMLSSFGILALCILDASHRRRSSSRSSSVIEIIRR